MLHRQDCGNVTRITDERRPRLLAANWNTGASVLHVVEIGVQAYDRQGLLRDISAALAAGKVNVIGVKSETESGVADMRFTLEVRDLTQLDRVLIEIKKLSSVRLARRVG